MAERSIRRRLLLTAPLGVAALGGTGFWVILKRMREGKFDPHGVPNPLVGHPVPRFSLPDLSSGPALDSSRFQAPDRPVLVNFFASWCQPCLEEAPQLTALKAGGIPLFGIAYKDKPSATSAFLKRAGNPYGAVGYDETGRVAIDWGVTGVPETFLIGRDGIIHWHWTGPVLPEMVEPLRRLAT